jgi:hydrogenase maturation protease
MTCVLGVGNVLMGDDGFGPAVVRRFEQEFQTGEDVAIVDIGTPGLDMTPWLADADHVIIVDTVKSDRPPGTLQVYDKRDVLEHPPIARVGPHDPGLKETLLALDFAERGPRTVTVIGVVPERVALGLELTTTLERAIPAALGAIADALAAHGLWVARRLSGSAPAAR